MELDPKVTYWTAALANMVAAFCIAAFGVRRIRSAQIQSHQRAMKIAASLVLFVLSYGVALGSGRERLDLWEPRCAGARHQACIAVMVLAGGRAAYLLPRAVSITAEWRGSPRARERRARTAAPAGRRS
jgi:uncharacterized membrane protein YozB (DUF420 family)